MYQLMGIKFGPIRSGRDKNQSEVAEAHLAFFHLTTLDGDHEYLATKNVKIWVLLI